jgi:hypothetical protein
LSQDAEWFEAKQSKRGGGGPRGSASAPKLDELEPEDLFEVC